MIVNFYNFSKKENSTAQPPASALIKSADCYLKDGCSILAPSIRLSWADDDMMPNYAQIPAWGRFYTVTNIEYQGSAIIIDMAVDALASYKAQIGASMQYVVRAASASDPLIVDSLYASKTRPESVRTIAASNWSNSGVFIVGVQGQAASNASVYGLTYYVMTPAEMRDLVAYLNTASHLETYAIDFGNNIQSAITALQTTFSSFVTDLAQYIFEPMRFIKTCTWLPITVADFFQTVSVSSVNLGGTAVPIATRQAAGNPMAINASLTAPAHPQAATRGAWVESQSFTQRVLYVPGVGNIPIPADLVRGGDTIAVSNDISLIDGSIIAEVQCYTQGVHSALIGKYAGQLGTPIALGTTTNDLLSAGMSIAGAGVAAASGNFLGAAQGVISAAQAAGPSPVTLGGERGMHPIFNQFLELESTFWTVADADNANHGSPLCAKRQISTLAGYVQTEGAALALAATEDEKSAVLRQMDSGFFYE